MIYDLVSYGSFNEVILNRKPLSSQVGILNFRAGIRELGKGVVVYVVD